MEPARERGGLATRKHLILDSMHSPTQKPIKKNYDRYINFL